MPFRTLCPYCRRKVLAPDQSFGGSVKCPACASWYTATPEAERGRSDRPPAARQGASAAALSSPLAPVEAPRPAEASPAAPLLVNWEPPGTAVSADSAEPAEPDAPSPLGVAACLMAGAALILASVESASFLTRPLAGLGALLGIVAVVVAPNTNTPRLLLPVSGAILSTLVFLVAVVWPSLLGSGYEANYRPSGYDAEAVRVIPLQLGPGAADNLETDGYADARRAAVQQGAFRVQILSATVGPVQVVDSKKRFTKQSVLAVSVRVQHIGHGDRVRFIHWGTTGERSVPDAVATADGRTLAPADLGSDVPVGVNYGHDLFPGRAVDDLLLFEAPTGSGPVRLELPAEAWGGKGTFKFQVPGSMLVTQTGRKPR